MSNVVTLVTCFFDISRSEKGDGRTIEEYMEWMKQTVLLNCNLYIVTEEKFKDFFMQHRPKEYNTAIHIIEFGDLHYCKYINRMREIMESEEYKNKIQDPERIECRMPEYNVIQYSKFHCLQMAIEKNPFKSTHFGWMDAGISRFFYGTDISVPYPGKKFERFLQKTKDQLIIQKRGDLDRFPIDDTFVWRSVNLLSGGMFLGSIPTIQRIAKQIEEIFVYHMLRNNNVNNEQLALAILWKHSPSQFFTTDTYPGMHLLLFRLMAE